jgi:putative redox protein
MNAKMTVHHLGADRFAIDIRGHRLVVDQPSEVDNEAGPTPTELFVAALASCAAHFAHRVLIRDDPDATVKVTCWFRTSTGAPNRVELVELEVALPPGLSAQRRASVERAMQHCTVHESLTQPPHVVISVAPETNLVLAMAPTNADAAPILEHARRTAGAGIGEQV